MLYGRLSEVSASAVSDHTNPVPISSTPNRSVRAKQVA
jgi:hypothetical protein